MTMQQNIEIARALLDGIAAGRDPAEVAAPFAEHLSFENQGDDGVMPWVGRSVGRQAMVNFLHGLRDLTEPLTFDVEDILASETRAVIVGSLRSRIKATGKITASQFALVLTIAHGIVSRFQMLEDSFDLSKAAR